MRKLKHSPLPWVADCDSTKHKSPLALVLPGDTGDKRQIAIDCTRSGKNYKQDCANAEFIARAVNSYYDLVAAIQRFLDSHQAALPIDSFSGEPKQKECLCGPCDEARKAIAKAKGETHAP